MKKCYFYFLIKPLNEQVIDDNTNIGFEIKIQNHNIALAFLQHSDGQPKALRFEVGNLEKEDISEQALNVIHSSKEHFLSIMRMNYDPDLEFLEKAIWHYTEVSNKPDLNLKFKEALSPPNAEAIKNVFINTASHRKLVKLLTDGVSTRLPLKFRYLSLYKIVEFKFLKRGKWQTGELKLFLSKYESKIDSKFFKRPLFNTIHDIRDRCAHFKTNGDGLGISSLNRKDEMEIQSIIEILVEVARDIVNTELSGSATILKHENI
ncbi:MAG: hypothetical protein WC635_12455 [Bacteriovorax sp.]|jgi:hypothetical protein